MQRLISYRLLAPFFCFCLMHERNNNDKKVSFLGGVEVECIYVRCLHLECIYVEQWMWM